MFTCFLQCKHQLAARLAASLGACIEVKVSDEKLALLLSKLWNLSIEYFAFGVEVLHEQRTSWCVHNIEARCNYKGSPWESQVECVH